MVQKRLEAGENPRELKAELGRAIVAFYHSENEAKKASEQFDKQFRDKEMPGEIEESVLKGDYPDLRATIIQISSEAPDLELSGSELRRLVKQGAVKVEGEPVQDIAQTFDVSKPVIVQYGKRKFRKYLPKS